jgi:hypothetical protein
VRCSRSALICASLLDSGAAFGAGAFLAAGAALLPALRGFRVPAGLPPVVGAADRSLTPLSGRNSTPAASTAAWMARRLLAVGIERPASKFRTVLFPT